MELLTGKEFFTDNGKKIGFTVTDFWSFQFSNILHDPDEIAEFLVAKALDIEKPYNKNTWTLFDILYRDKRVEVKETSYYHSFNEPGKVSSRRSFGITKAYSENGILERQNDVYVFCLLNGDNPKDAWPLETSHWEFYIVPTSVINKECEDQKSISLNKVRQFAEPKTYSEIKAAIDELIDKKKSNYFFNL